MMTRKFSLIICIGLLALGQIAQTQGEGQGRPPHGKPSQEDRDKFRQKIGLSVQQQTQMDTVFEEMGRERKPLGDKLRELHKQRHELLSAYTMDRSKEKALRAEITALYGRMLQLHTESEEKMRRIMNREQFDRLQQMMREKRSQDGNRSRRERGGRDNGKNDSD